MLQFWGGVLVSTKDIDLLSAVTATVEDLVVIIAECVLVGVEDDGLRFDANSVAGEEIRLAANYNGVRLKFKAFLGNAQIPMPVNMGFGDAITPKAEIVQYPSILSLSEAKLLGYWRTVEVDCHLGNHFLVLLDWSRRKKLVQQLYA